MYKPIPEAVRARHMEVLRAIGSTFDGIPTPCEERAAIDAAIQALTAAQPQLDGGGEVAQTARCVAKAIDEGEGFWHPCSGCHETSEGYNVQGFPYSATFRCYLGGGCHECGGLGAVWISTAYVEEDAAPPTAPVEDAVAYLDNWLRSAHGLDIGRVAVGEALERALAQQPAVCGTCGEAIRPDTLTGTTCARAPQPASAECDQQVHAAKTASDEG